MRSIERRLSTASIALALAGGVAAQPVAPAEAASASAAASSPSYGFTAAAVRAAASAVEADPLLGSEYTEKELRFKSKDEEKQEKKKPPEDWRWWRDLMENLSVGLRVAMWLVGAALLIWVLLRVRDWLLHRDGAAASAVAAPTHVGTLDIRPESLPDDIGAAARALWERGERRGALSLLYRGALSRLVHGHGVPIRAASTERECLALAADRLGPESQDFLAQLILGWQTVAYARRELPAERFEHLCAAFDARLTPGATR